MTVATGFGWAGSVLALSLTYGWWGRVRIAGPRVLTASPAPRTFDKGQFAMVLKPCNTDPRPPVRYIRIKGGSAQECTRCGTRWKPWKGENHP